LLSPTSVVERRNRPASTLQHSFIEFLQSQARAFELTVLQGTRKKRAR
jgi:hypothetical protein